MIEKSGLELRKFSLILSLVTSNTDHVISPGTSREKSESFIGEKLRGLPAPTWMQNNSFHFHFKSLNCRGIPPDIHIGYTL